MEFRVRPGAVAAAAVLIGGLLVVLVPHHAPSIVRIVLVTLAAAAALYALMVNAPPDWWTSPFDRGVPTPPEEEQPDELDRIRARFSGRRQVLEASPPMPPETIRALQPLIRAALERAHPDPHDELPRGLARRSLSPATRAVLAGDPVRRPPWFRTRRADEREVAEGVRRVLDDLDRLDRGAQPRSDPRSSHSLPPDATKP